MPSISKAVNLIKQIANDDTHGYDQKNRLGPDYDCSSLVSTVLHEAGFNILPYSWTGSMKKQLLACGFKECLKPWKAGDIHLNEKHHVCMSISPSQIAQASVNELGTVTGGKTGDQTGREINISSYYEYEYGWDVHLRYSGKDESMSGKMSTETIARQVINGLWSTGDERKKRLQEAGYDYQEIQNHVNSLLSGEKKKTSGEIAREVIQGKWNVGEKRKELLTKAGYDYEEIQLLVNQMLGK